MKRALFTSLGYHSGGLWLALAAWWLLAPLTLAPAAFAADSAPAPAAAAMPAGAPLCFTAESDGAAVGLIAVDETDCEDENEDIAEAERKAPKLDLEISRDGQDWQEWKKPRKIELPRKGDRAYVRAKSTNPGFGKKCLHEDGSEEKVANCFTITGKVAASGNVMTLLDRTGRLRSLAGLPCAFIGLFVDCDGLTTPPELPATELADECYAVMFMGCAGLTAAPELPATIMAQECYAGMFEGCASLTAAPALPATKLAKGCYSFMFGHCDALATAPALPATKMADDCYEFMFYRCNKLTTAPELPATGLAEGCYTSMFAGCKGLTVAPKLPATELAQRCYAMMFYECKELTTAPEFPATVELTDDNSEMMFKGCDKLKNDPIKRK